MITLGLVSNYNFGPPLCIMIPQNKQLTHFAVYHIFEQCTMGHGIKKVTQFVGGLARTSRWLCTAKNTFLCTANEFERTMANR